MQYRLFRLNSNVRLSRTNPMKEPTIVPLANNQFSQIATLCEAQLKEHGIISSTDALVSSLRAVVEQPQFGFILVASTDSLAVGFAYASCLLSLEHSGWSGWLEELYVLPEWRGCGLGTQLLDAIIAGATERCWKALDLEVDADHQRVISLYARRNFLPVPRTRFVRHICNEPNI